MAVAAAISLGRGLGKVSQEMISNPGSPQNVLDVTSLCVIAIVAAWAAVGYSRYFGRARLLPNEVKDECWGASPIRMGTLKKIVQDFDAATAEGIVKPVLVWKVNAIEVWDVANPPTFRFRIPIDQVSNPHFSSLSGDPELLGPFLARVRGVYVRLSLTGFDVEGEIHFFGRDDEQQLIQRFRNIS